MWNNVKRTIITVLATLGVLFIIIMIWPDDDQENDNTSVSPAGTSASVSELTVVSTETSASAENTGISVSTENTETSETTEISTDNNNTGAVSVNIPSEELSSNTLKFVSVSLDGDKVTQDIFSDYDITVVHVWGTFCGPCIAEMGEYAEFYKELPSNVNLIGIICDVYDGIESNVADAKEILGDAGAEFTNLRTSDDLYDITAEFQYVPSSFLVDREGHVVGQMMDGVSFSDTKARLDEYIQ